MPPPPFNDLLRMRTHALLSTLNSHRLFLYTFFSFLAVSAAITNALRNYSNFYSVAISLSKSNRSVLALANFGFLLSLLCGHVVQRIFFGALRANEVERLYDRLWFFITESLLAFTIFRDEFDIPFAVMFGFLLFVKSFHWLAGDRIEWMDQRPYPGPSPLFHLRMTTLFIILWLTDFTMFLVAVENTIAHGVGGMVLFASEYGILMASVLNTISKYLLSAYELRRAGRRGGENAPPWENKSMWVFYIELATDFLKLTTYLVFFTIIITFYGLPLNIVRDVYITARSFITRLRALHRYQSATRNMDQRYPNATREELGAMTDHTCIICREEMVLTETGQDQGQAPAIPDGPNTTPKKLPCGHIFHFHCLRSWLERQQSCPTCRRTVLDTQPPNIDPPALGVAAVQGEPQQPNNPPEPAQNQDNQNNPLGNPLGLMGRLFGPAAQQPVIPGQPPAAHFPQNQENAPQNPGNMAVEVPPGVLIQYHIQYQMPRDQHQNNEQTLHPLQPPPPFRGFPGPEGAWHQWPLPPVAPHDPNPEPRHSTPPRTINTQPGERETPASSTAPREAAALAALRRINSNNNDHRVSEATASSPPAPLPPRSSMSAEAPLTPALNMPANSMTLGQTSANVPQLVPIYDYSTIIAGTTPIEPVSSAQTPSRSVSEPHVSPRHAGISELSTRVPQQAQQHRDQHNSGSLLPPSLTNEQLAVMDRLTREAIDERLRVLEGISGATYRCIDDLMRMRSVLPPSSEASNPLESFANSELSNGDRASFTLSAKHPENKEELRTSGHSGPVNGERGTPTRASGGASESTERSSPPVHTQ